MNNVIQLSDFHISPLESYRNDENIIDNYQSSSDAHTSTSLYNPLVIQEPIQEQSQDHYDQTSTNPIHLDIGRAIKQSKYICKYFITSSSIKILLLLALVLYGFECTTPLQYWLYMMLSYDSLYILNNVTMMYKKIIIYSKYLHKTSLRFLLINYDPTDPEYQDTNLSGFILGQCLQHYQQINGIQIMSSCEHCFKCIGSLAEFLRIYYIMLFIFGNILLYLDLTPPQGFDHIVFMIYLSLGYLYLIIPLLLCICWPCIVVGIYCIQFNQDPEEVVQATQQRQKPINKTIIKKHLKSKKYSQVMPEEVSEQKEQCTICYCDYQENQQIIQLPCNIGHYFHKECCEKWLSINGTCPICRKDIEKLIKNST